MAKYAKVELPTAILLLRKYFDTFKPKPPAFGTLTEDQIAYLTSEEYLRRNATVSLAKRVADFKQLHPQVKLTRYRLKQLYDTKKIHKKAVVKVAANPSKYSQADVAALRS